VVDWIDIKQDRLKIISRWLEKSHPPRDRVNTAWGRRQHHDRSWPGSDRGSGTWTTRRAWSPGGGSQTSGTAGPSAWTASAETQGGGVCVGMKEGGGCIFFNLLLNYMICMIHDLCTTHWNDWVKLRISWCLLPYLDQDRGLGQPSSDISGQTLPETNRPTYQPHPKHTHIPGESYIYIGVQKFLYTIEIINFFNTKHLISRQQTNLSR